MKTSFSKQPSNAAPAHGAGTAAPAAATTTVDVTATVTPETPTPSAAPVTPEAPTATPAAAPTTSTAVARPEPRPYDDESIDASDLRLGRINLAQRVGDLGIAFAPGTVVYDQSLPLIDAPPTNPPNTPSKPFRFVVIGFQPKKYVEKVPYGTQGGQVFDSEQEVVSFGGTLDYTEAQQKKIPLFERLATALLLIEQPEGLDAAAFPHSIDGKKYQLALYAMKGSAYTAAARILMTARKIGHLRAGGYRSGFWTFQTLLKKFQNGNAAFVPVVKPAGPSSQAVQNAIKDLIGF